MRSWQFFGGPGSWPYRMFDAMRRQVNRRLVRNLLARSILGKGARILEAGSGSSFGSSLFARSAVVTLSVAVDLDVEALRETRRRDRALAVVAADVHALPFLAQSFDLVWSSSTLEHLQHPQQVIAEMRRLTKEGGHLFIGVPYGWGPLWFQPLIRRTSLGIWLGPVFDRAALIRMVREQGLEPTATITYCCKCFVGVLARRAVERPTCSPRRAEPMAAFSCDVPVQVRS